VKTDSEGNPLWEKTFGGDFHIAFSVALASDGGFVASGLTRGAGLLLKTDSEGNLLWEKTFGGSLMSVQGTSDGGYVGAGGDLALCRQPTILGDVEDYMHSWRKDTTDLPSFVSSYPWSKPVSCPTGGDD